MTDRSGRAKFGRYGALISAACALVRWIPRPLRNLLWDMSRPFGGHLALLLRYALLRADSGAIGENVYIGRNVTILNRDGLRIGSNVSIHENCYLDAIGGCEIGNDVSIAHGCSLVSFNHTWEDGAVAIKYNPISKAPITIAVDVWIGAGVRLLGGAVIETRSVVAAGAVVTGFVPSGTLYGGVPARKLRDLVFSSMDSTLIRSPVPSEGTV